MYALVVLLTMLGFPAPSIGIEFALCHHPLPGSIGRHRKAEIFVLVRELDGANTGFGVLGWAASLNRRLQKPSGA